MPNESVQFNLTERFAAPLPEFYRRRIIFWKDEDREFEKDVDELNLEGVKIIKLTGTNNFAVKKLLLHDDLDSNYLIYCPITYTGDEDNWLQDIEYYSETFRADFISMQMDELNIAPSAAMRKTVKLYARFFDSKERIQKLRVRSYGVPEEGDTVFVELKKKFDGIVYKHRVTTELPMVKPLLTGLLEKNAFGQIGREIDWFQRCNKTVPKVFIGYDRTAFAGTDDPELRVTFDTKLRWRTSKLDLAYGDQGMLLLPQDAVLMEVKLPGVCPLWLSRALSELSIYQTSFSKYGACYQKHLLPRMRKTGWEDMFCA